jgi:hypothetical protein
MDFMKLLKSLEELLYELISWFIFYPLTLWRIIRRPIQMLSYAERQLLEEEDRQFDDSLSPPILLLITLIVLHGLGNALAPEEMQVLSGVLADDRNLLIFRAVSFSLFPLLFGLLQLKINRARLTRTTFKPIFYSQCYAAIPFVVAVSLGLQLSAVGHQPALVVWAGGLIFAAGFVWYIAVETLWLSRSAKMHPALAATMVVTTLVLALPLFVLIALVVGVVSESVALPPEP